MAKNYLTYPFKIMRITQSYTGTTSHKPHSTGRPKDYPWDEGGKDSGRDGFYCPCDELKIVKIYGVGNGGTNTIWVESTSKVDFADGTTDYTCGHLIHPNDGDIKDLRVGQKFKRGQLICYEGIDGATGNHLHISFGKGKMKDTGWTKNTKGKWVLTTTNGTFKPEELFYIDKSFTTIKNTKGISFKELPNTIDNEAPQPTTPVLKTPVLKFKVGAIMQFAGGKHYTSANAISGSAVKASKVKITAVYAKGKHQYHCRAIDDTGKFIDGVYGWVDESTLSVAKIWKPSVGDIVNYNGKVHYANANAKKGTSCKGGKAKITQIYQLGKSKHPYHLVAVSSGNSSVYGWVDAGTFTKI